MNEGYWIRCGPVFRKVEGRPVHVADGIETFAHRPLVRVGRDRWEVNGIVWEISDARTGLAFGVWRMEGADTIEGAAGLAKEKLEDAIMQFGGIENWLKALDDIAVTPRYWDEYYDSDTAPVPLEGARVIR
jgi:hypothetical protein